MSRILTVLSCVLLLACSDDIRCETTQKRFVRMVQDNEVANISIVNGQIVEINLTPEALAKPKYRGLFLDQKPSDDGDPHFLLTIVSEEAFRKELETLNPGFPVNQKKRSFFSSFFQ